MHYIFMNVYPQNIGKSCALLELQKEMNKAYRKKKDPDLTDSECEHLFWQDILDAKMKASLESVR